MVSALVYLVSVVAVVLALRWINSKHPETKPLPHFLSIVFVLLAPLTVAACLILGAIFGVSYAVDHAEELSAKLPFQRFLDRVLGVKK